MTVNALRVALLLAGTLNSAVVESYGDYIVQYSKLLQKAIERGRKNVKLEIRPYDVVNKMEFPNEEELAEMDGVIITGSAAAAYDDIPWINRLVGFTANLVDEHPNVKLIGVCFGHQIVARAMGGPVIKNPLGWEIAVTEFSLTDAGRKFFKTDKKALRLQEMHQDHVPYIPPNFYNIGSNSTSPVQGMIKDNQVLTIQGHPEFVGGTVKEIIKRGVERKIFTPEFAQKCLTAADYEDDSMWMGQKFIQFLLGEIEPDVINYIP